ncbi:nuclease-related domain-containing protein [Streptomyces africanus]|uniref:nuclease-related domain-containing protein n=1 Tax=Streptomyces africanus TaxID=231024 RepID=UPI000A3C6DA0|nr:nuclease-related domain-containing protein [Streptomyces africanus]
MSAGGSALRWGQERRRAARRGPWRWLLARLGLSASARRADALAARTALGAEWEQYTARMLSPLEAVGWRVLHDRRLPGRGTANLDHVLVSPCGTAVVVLDTKRWDRSRTTSLIRGRVCVGAEDRHRQVEAVARYAARAAEAIGVPGVVVWPLLVVHGSWVAGGRLEARAAAWDGPVWVLGPDFLVPTLAKAPAGRDPVRAGRLARRVDEVLRPYAG